MQHRSPDVVVRTYPRVGYVISADDGRRRSERGDLNNMAGTLTLREERGGQGVL